MNVITLTWNIEKSETASVRQLIEPLLQIEEPKIIVIAIQNIADDTLNKLTKKLTTGMYRDFGEHYVARMKCGQVLRGIMLATIVLSNVNISFDCKHRCISRHMGYMTVVLSHGEDCLLFTNVHLSPRLKHRASKIALLNTLKDLAGSRQFQELSKTKCRKACLNVVLGDFNSYSKNLTYDEIECLSEEEISYVQTETPEQTEIVSKIKNTDYITRLLKKNQTDYITSNNDLFSKYDQALIKILHEEKWREEAIVFQPTFPWGHNVLEAVTYSRFVGGLMPMQRIVTPAYADRILYKSENYYCKSYELLAPYDTISHRAVCAVFIENQM